MQPITGPIYRYPDARPARARSRRYYDGSWLINNRGADNGFWKEVQLRKDNNEMLRVNEWLPYNGGVNPSGANSSLVIGTQFGPDGNLYMARYQVGCCRSGTVRADQNQIVKISFNVHDECVTDTAAPNASAEVTGQAYPDTPNTYVNTAKLRLSATDSGCAGVKNLEYRQAGPTDWLPYSAEVTFDEGKTYNIEYRATDRKDNVSAVKTATFTVLKINDTTAPHGDGRDVGQQGPARQLRRLRHAHAVRHRRRDRAPASRRSSTAPTAAPGRPTPTPVAFNAAGNYTVDYRATDKVNNTSVPKQVTFRILSGAGCTQTRSDEFDGTALGAQWTRHTRNGGTPRERHHVRRAASCTCRRPTSSSTLPTRTTSRRPGQLHRPGPAARWARPGSVETEFTVKYTGGWQNAGLIVWNGDNNFFRSSITHSLSAGNIYVEQSKDNPTSTEGARSQSGSNIASRRTSPARSRSGCATTRANGRQHGRPAVPDHGSGQPPRRLANFADFGGSANLIDLNPSGGARRDAAGSRIGIIAQSNFPGTTGTHPYNGTPGTVRRELLPGHPGPVHLRDDRADHHGDARPGGSDHRRHVRPLGQGHPRGDRHRHQRLGRRLDGVPRHHQRGHPRRSGRRTPTA